LSTRKLSARPDQIALDAVRRPGPAAPVSSELSLQGTLPFSRWIVHGPEDRGRPQAHCGCTTAQVGRLSSSISKLPLAVHLAPDRPPSPLEGAFTQTAGAAATRYFRSRTRACARAIRRRDRPKPSGRDCSLRAVIEVPSSIVEPRLPCPEAAPTLADEGRGNPAHGGRCGQLYRRTTARSASDPLGPRCSTPLGFGGRIRDQPPARTRLVL